MKRMKTGFGAKPTKTSIGKRVKAPLVPTTKAEVVSLATDTTPDEKAVKERCMYAFILLSFLLFEHDTLIEVFYSRKYWRACTGSYQESFGIGA